MKRPWAVAAVAFVILVAGGYAAWRWRAVLLEESAGAARITVSGNIEAHESVLSFTQVQAAIIELPFDEGAHVTRGTVLARVDDSLYQRQVMIDRANEQVASAQVAVNESSLAAARSNVSSDQFDLAEKQRDAARAEELVKTAATSVQTRDLTRTAAQQSAATLAHDQSLLQVASANIALARANEAAAAAKLALDQVVLGYATLRAPFDGVISVREAERGQLAGPGVAIFTLDDLDHVWLRAYGNERDIGRIRLSESADVTTDSYPGKIYHGRISFISPEAEFTPKTVETNAERVTLVYRIRIDISNPTHELLPGMPTDAAIKLLPAGK
ncbi:MAG TPA: efflux RND transporter periplasmic adaptor subunit [Steroidobacteraceae bacterium]|nr:efflux RND transporter periplasmic adaptor subunit [Steroidobacteraceae bacterium]